MVSPDGPPRYPYGNCLYLEDKTKTIIDLGAGGQAFHSLPCHEIQLALISHFHFDHIHSSGFFPEASLYAGWQEEPAYRDEHAYMDFHGYSLWSQIMPEIPREAYGSVHPLPGDIPVRPGFRFIPLSGTFTDLQQFNIGHMTVTALYLPGHTIGHYGFYLEKEGILFSGDIDLVPTGPWYSSNTADVAALVRSVQRILEINPRIVVPSHRRIQSENIPAQLRQHIQVVIDRHQRILESLSHPHTLKQLSDYQMVYSEPRNMYELFWDRMTIRNHLRQLIKEKLIEEIEPGVYLRK